MDAFTQSGLKLSDDNQIYNFYEFGYMDTDDGAGMAEFESRSHGFLTDDYSYTYDKRPELDWRMMNRTARCPSIHNRAYQNPDYVTSDQAFPKNLLQIYQEQGQTFHQYQAVRFQR